MSQATGAELVSAFEPHPTVRHHLLFLLHQYAQHSLSSIVRDAFASLPMNAMNVQVTLHEYVDIAAQGYFQGYRDSFSIAATNRYGQDNRQRYDTVEVRSEEHTSELQSLMRSSYAVFCLKKK